MGKAMVTGHLQGSCQSHTGQSDLRFTPMYSCIAMIAGRLQGIMLRELSGST